MPRTTATEATTATRGPVQDDVNSRLFFRLFQAANLYEREVQKALDTSAVQCAILSELSRRPGRSVPFAELVEYLAFSRQNLDGVLKRLERQGYVERIEDASNRRARIVRLTPTGQRAWKQSATRSSQFYRACTAGLTQTHRNALMDALEKVSGALRNGLPLPARGSRAAAVAR